MFLCPVRPCHSSGASLSWHRHLWFFFLVDFFAHSSRKTGAVPNVRTVVLYIYMHCVPGGIPALCRFTDTNWNLPGVLRKGLWVRSMLHPPAAEITRYAWLWNCARILMQRSFRLWAINATQQVSISPSLVLSLGASGTVYNRQLAFWTGFQIWNISSSVRMGYRNDNMLCSVMTVIYPVVFLNRFSFLGAFITSWKAIIIFHMSVCPFVHPHGTTRFPLEGSSLHFYIRLFLRKSVGIIQVSLKSDKNNGYFTGRSLDFFLSYLAKSFLE